MLELGIDEAGRGPVIGPMVMACVLIREESGDRFRNLGVKDSKDVSKKNIPIIARKIPQVEGFVAYEKEIIIPSIIDEYVAENKLNILEAEKAADLINKIRANYGEEPIRVYIDTPQKNTASWREAVLSNLDSLEGLEIICENGADVNYVCAAAASIIAKAERESQMTIVKQFYKEKELGEVGSGYASDRKTIDFIEKNFNAIRGDGHVRLSWATCKKIMAHSNQQTL